MDNWTQDSRGQWHWTPTKEMVREEYRVINPRGDYFSPYNADGSRRDDRMRS